MSRVRQRVRGRVNRPRTVAAVAVAVSGLVGLVASCQVRSIDLGANGSPAPAPPPSEAGPRDAARDVDSPLTFEQRLRVLCKEPTGPRDLYTTARDLTSHLQGRWFLCDEPTATPFGDPSGLEVDRDGGWRSLTFDEARESLVPTGHPDEEGSFDYYAFSDPDAGVGADGGGGSRIVPRDDPTPRSGLFIYFHRGLSTDLVVLVDFETQPRRMFVRDVGPSSLGAAYVAVP